MTEPGDVSTVFVCVKAPRKMVSVSRIATGALELASDDEALLAASDNAVDAEAGGTMTVDG
jgi:hypothetical protein